ncbi:MAG: coniferyl aldehyde dehydrogenase [Oceanicoccus sp.]|uniref:coniferyl aldehyde dehydrogenase n=1 Tax=Oceanicoccus sp. TaxID=2691044 RepID=UPI00262D7E66|nr:coniferyl aldehyde dehydrogenase [Oceanicoccus sp.]MCP3908853.1 coniferyl aldehyde dehydrogenase [Oceanicoccus sp.]
MNALNDPAVNISQAMNTVLDKQKQAFIDEGAVSLATRVDRMDRSIAQLVKYTDKLAEAMNSDFGHRSPEFSRMFDVAAGVSPMQHAKKHVKQWMRTEKRKTMFPLNFLGARSRVEYQPLGTIGIISPWNFPVNLTFAPLANAFSAGNRAMIKPSEFTPATSEVMKEMIEEVYDESEVAVFTGGPEVGQAFSGLAFDHLIFTGATSVARHVMSAAAKNLVPLTLELGGKSPVVIGRDADLKLTCDRLMWGKVTNAGQICLAPDYCYLPEEKLDQIIEGFKASVAAMVPTLLDNKDFTSIINERHYSRLQSYIADAKAKGATIIEISPANESFEGQPHHKMPPTLILNAPDDALCMQEEIFGPLLPVRTYKDFKDSVAFINKQPRALALYYFGFNAQEERYVLDHTVTGGVTINDVLMHVTQEDLPFGGVGPSGMGCYHGFDGFKAFSHAKAIYSQPKIDLAGMTGMAPPYNKKTEKTIKMMLK